MDVDFNFRFYWCYGTVSLEFDLNWFPCEQSSLRDVIAFLNGGFKSDFKGYWLITDEGLLHFAFLTNQLDEYHSQWRLSNFSCHKIRQNARDHMNGF